MTKPFALSVLLMLASGAALADVPNRSTSTQPRGLPLVGHAGAAADPLGSATFVIRHASNTPMSGALVVIDFSACTDVRLSADALEPGFSLDCTNHVIRGIADRNGQVTFHIVGEGNGAGPRALSACAAVYADGVPFGSLDVATFDLDGSGGVNAMDLGIMAMDIAPHAYWARSDFDFDGDVDAIDLGRLAQVLVSGGSRESGLANCGP